MNIEHLLGSRFKSSVVHLNSWILVSIFLPGFSTYVGLTIRIGRLRNRRAPAIIKSPVPLAIGVTSEALM